MKFIVKVFKISHTKFLFIIRIFTCFSIYSCIGCIQNRQKYLRSSRIFHSVDCYRRFGITYRSRLQGTGKKLKMESLGCPETPVKSTINLRCLKLLEVRRSHFLHGVGSLKARMWAVSIEKSVHCEINRCPASQEILHILWHPKRQYYVPKSLISLVYPEPHTFIPQSPIIFLTVYFNFFAPYIVIELHNKNKGNASFSKLIFTLLCLLNVSKLLGSYSRRQLCMQYGVFLLASVWAVWWAGQCVRVCSVSNTPAYPPECETYHTAYTAVSLRMELRGLKHVGDNRNIKLCVRLICVV